MPFGLTPYLSGPPPAEKRKGSLLRDEIAGFAPPAPEAAPKPRGSILEAEMAGFGLPDPENLATAILNEAGAAAERDMAPRDQFPTAIPEAGAAARSIGQTEPFQIERWPLVTWGPDGALIPNEEAIEKLHRQYTGIERSVGGIGAMMGTGQSAGRRAHVRVMEELDAQLSSARNEIQRMRLQGEAAGLDVSPMVPPPLRPLFGSLRASIREQIGIERQGKMEERQRRKFQALPHWAQDRLLSDPELYQSYMTGKTGDQVLATPVDPPPPDHEVVNGADGKPLYVVARGKSGTRVSVPSAWSKDEWAKEQRKLQDEKRKRIEEQYRQAYDTHEKNFQDLGKEADKIERDAISKFEELHRSIANDQGGPLFYNPETGKLLTGTKETKLATVFRLIQAKKREKADIIAKQEREKTARDYFRNALQWIPMYDTFMFGAAMEPTAPDVPQGQLGPVADPTAGMDQPIVGPGVVNTTPGRPPIAAPIPPAGPPPGMPSPTAPPAPDITAQLPPPTPGVDDLSAYMPPELHISQIPEYIRKLYYGEFGLPALKREQILEILSRYEMSVEDLEAIEEMMDDEGFL